MISEWFYYPSVLLLLVSNLVAWTGNFYRLPANWIVFANCLLFNSLLTESASKFGLSWFSLCLIGLLAALGDSVNFAVKRQLILQPSASSPGRSRVFVGAGLGSVTCVAAGLAVPVIGPMLAILGAVGGAAGGAWFGSLVSPKAKFPVEDVEPQESWLARLLRDKRTEKLPRIIAGFLMLSIAFSSTIL